MATNTQKVVKIGKKLKCGWCLSLIDETTGRCSKPCKIADLHRQMDELKDKADELKDKAEEASENKEDDVE